MRFGRWLSPVWLGLSAALLIGCADDGGGGGTAIVEVGTGTTEVGTGTTIDFVELSNDDELGIIAGPQGGHHFKVHARAKNIIPGDPSLPALEANPRTIFQAFTEAGTQIDLRFPPYRLGYRRTGDWFVLPSARILLVEEDVISELIGQRMRITVQVTDAAGARGNDERWIVVTEAQIPDSDAGTFDAGVDRGVDAAAPDAASSL